MKEPPSRAARFRRRPYLHIPPLVLGALLSAGANAGQWRMTPSVNLAETYSDNILLAPEGAEEEEYITQINPGLRINGRGGRTRLNLQYRMQNLIYAREEGRTRSHHQLSANGNAELIKRTVFVDADASVRQQVVDPEEQLPFDTLNRRRLADVVRYGVSPYVSRNRGSVATTLRYSVDRVEYHSANQNQISDSTFHRYQARFGNDHRVQAFTWQLQYDRRDQVRESRDNSRRESASGEARYRLSSAWYLLGRGGYENNDIQTSRRYRDGAYWSVGAGWRPSRRFEIEAAYGDRELYGRTRIAPTTRTMLQAQYRDREVGVNPGVVWDINLRHRARHSTWQARYEEDNTTVQSLSLGDLGLISPGGGDLAEAGRRIDQSLLESAFTLTDEEFLRKRGEVSVNINTGKSQLGFLGFQEERVFEVSGDTEETYGGNASWGWQVGARTRSEVSGGWQRREFPAVALKDEFWHSGLGLIRQIGPETRGGLQYRHIVRSAAGPSRNYTENRLTVYLNKQF